MAMWFTPQLKTTLEDLPFAERLGSQSNRARIFDRIGQWSFAIDVFPCFQSGEDDIFVLVSCRCDKNGCDLGILKNCVVIGGLLGFWSKIAGALQKCRVIIAQR